MKTTNWDSSRVRIWYRFLTCVTYWYQFFSCVRNRYQFFTCKRNWYQFFTCKRNWYQFFTCKRNWYQFFTCKRNWYQFFTHVRVIGINSAHPKKNTGHRCEEYLPILYTSEIINEFFTCVRNWYQFFTPEKKVAPVLHRCNEYLPILHTSEIINMRNLSKLTIRKFHIWQMWRFGTNSSCGCEIYEMRNLRFNLAISPTIKVMGSNNGVARTELFYEHQWKILKIFPGIASKTGTTVKGGKIALRENKFFPLIAPILEFWETILSFKSSAYFGSDKFFPLRAGRVVKKQNIHMENIKHHLRF